MYRNRYLCKWSRGWPLNNGGTPGWIKDCTMAGAIKQLVLLIVADRTARMGAGRIEGNELIAG
jgi:hypothetical protein